MLSNDKKHLGLFVCHDLIGLLIINDLVPKLVQQGWNLTIYNTGNKRNRRAKVLPPAEPAFYAAGIVDRGLLPFLDEGQGAITSAATQASGQKYSYKKIANIYGCDYHEVDDVNSPELYQEILSDERLSGAISIRFLQIFDQKIISLIEQKGFFWNLHGGTLPEYKGLLIPYRAIENGEENYGWTLHRMATAIDAGDIVTIRERPLDPKRAIYDLYLDMIPAGIEMITSSLDEFIKTGLYKKAVQSLPLSPSYYSYPTEEEMDKFNKMGVRFIHSPFAHIEGLVDQFGGNDVRYRSNLRDELIACVRSWHEYVGREIEDRKIRSDAA